MKDLFSKIPVKKLLLVLPVFFSVLLVIILVSKKSGPERLPVKERAVTVRTITITPVEMVPRIKGFGKAVPQDEWQAVSQVSGTVIKMNSLLKQGSLVKKGTFLAKIDPREYELAVVRMKASIAEAKAKINQIEIENKNLKLSLAIEEESLKLSLAEWKRQKALYRKKIISRAVFDSETQKYNSQLLKVQNIKNSLNLIPSNRRQLAASLSLNNANLENAKRDLQNTLIKAPYNCRITKVSIQKHKYVQKGQTMISADGTEVAEINAQIPVEKMLAMVSSFAKVKDFSAFDFPSFREKLGLTVKVKFNAGLNESVWDGRFSRTDSAIDQQTGTAGVIVAVDKPYSKIIPGKRPPLVRNMYCEVEITGKAVPDTIVIPRSSLHGDYVYLVNSKKRLVRRKIYKSSSQSVFHVISSGLKEGETLIASDVIPAIDGMLLNPVKDINLEKMLLNEATKK